MRLSIHSANFHRKAAAKTKSVKMMAATMSESIDSVMVFSFLRFTKMRVILTNSHFGNPRRDFFTFLFGLLSGITSNYWVMDEFRKIHFDFKTKTITPV